MPENKIPEFTLDQIKTAVRKFCEDKGAVPTVESGDASAALSKDTTLTWADLNGRLSRKGIKTPNLSTLAQDLGLRLKK